jgi:putative ABC transport system permease protein
MNLFQQFYEAVESLSINKLRSGLTMLGIVIGVAAVIAMLAIGRGAQASITSSIEGIGTNVIFVFSGGGQDVKNPRPLTLEDARALADPMNAPSVARVAPSLQTNGEVTYSGQSTSTTIYGVTPDYAIVRNLAVTEGGMISDAQLTSRAGVAVIGIDVANSLFGRTNNLVGETIRVIGQPFRIIGVLESKGGSGMGSQDNQILVPMTTAQSRLIHRRTRDQVDLLYIEAVDANSVQQAVTEITETLDARHNRAPGEEDFSVFNQQDILSTAQSITGVLTIFLGGIAGISLLVGGIGIMNIMFVSVSERTREIGLRKAIGARKRDILAQFLMESSVLSLIGGSVGILLAWGIATLVGRIAAANDVGITPVIQLDAVLLATIFSAAVGLFFGFYPALRAANLEPVEALRSE